jgi:phage-related protein
MSKLSLYKIYFYKTSSGKEIITDFIDSFSNKTTEKIRSDIRLLKQYGLSLLSTSKIKKITRLPNLYELRIKTSVQIRLFFVFVAPNIFLIVHSFVKKSNKTPAKEIDSALNRIKEFDIK